MQKQKAFIQPDVMLLLCTAALMVYVAIRAASLDMTHDEAYSFYNVKHFWWVEALCTGNTHWFNFLAIKTSILLGFEKAGHLRWFSLLSAGVSLTVAFYWIRQLTSLPLKALAFGIALLNPFMIDYLSLARGYSAALMFEVVSISCYCLAIYKHRRALGTWALVLAGMSAIANFNFFYFFVAFAFIHACTYYIKQGSAILKQRLLYAELLGVLAVVALVIKALRFIEVCSNDIGGYGGNELIDSLFSSFIRTLLYRNFNFSDSLIQVTAYVLCLGLLAMCGYGIILFKQHKNTWYRLSSALFMLMLGLTVFNKWVLGVLYPTDRTLLMFYPLMALVVCGFFKVMAARFRFLPVLMYVLSACCFLNFLYSINVHRTFDYYQQADTQKAFSYLQTSGAKQVGIHPELYGVYRNYYQLTDDERFSFVGESINVYAPKGEDPTKTKLRQFDYIVLFPPYDLSFYKNNQVKLRAVNYYKNTGTLILKIE